MHNSIKKRYNENGLKSIKTINYTGAIVSRSKGVCVCMEKIEKDYFSYFWLGTKEKI